jgi:hypothetical protein
MEGRRVRSCKHDFGLISALDGAPGMPVEGLILSTYMATTKELGFSFAGIIS